MTYELMHGNETVAVVQSGFVDVKLPAKLPFGLRSKYLDYNMFMDWLRKRTDNLQRSYMNKVYMARKVGRELENILKDSCTLSITDQFWVNCSDIGMTWEKLQEIRDRNEALSNVALFGNTVNLDWEAVRQGATSLFAVKGAFPKAIFRNTMLKCGGTQEREWVASVIGKALELPVQDVVIKSGLSGKDDTLVEITLFTCETSSLVHASEWLAFTKFGEAHREGQHHRYFYERLPNEQLKREFERVLILNWLISNHDMHGENFGCLYNPDTFEITGIAPSFDHNSADFDGTIPELDVPDIVIPALKYHGDIIDKIESGALETVLCESIKNWLTPEQKNGVITVGKELVGLYKNIN